MSLSARTRESRKPRKTGDKSANGKNSITASELGRLGGKARWNGLTPEQRKELAKKAAAARWKKKECSD